MAGLSNINNTINSEKIFYYCYKDLLLLLLYTILLLLKLVMVRYISNLFLISLYYDDACITNTVHHVTFNKLCTILYPIYYSHYLLLP